MAYSGRVKGEAVSPGSLRPLLGFALVVLLAVAIAIEAYYIFVLRDRIDKQTEELRNLSIQVQSSKSESTELRKELSSMKKLAGEKNDGNTTDGQH